MPATDYPIVRLSNAAGEVVDPGGGGSSSLQSYALLTNASATGAPATNVRGGKYLWSAEGNFNGATLTLQRQRQNGTWAGFSPAATFTAEGIAEVLIGQGASIQVLVTGGTPSGLYSNLAGVE